LVILAVVLVRGRAISRVFATSGSAVEERPPVRVPAALRSSPLVRYQRPGWERGQLFRRRGDAEAAVFPHRGAPIPCFALVLVYALLAVALTMLVGWGGQVSLGHFGRGRLGAY